MVIYNKQRNIRWSLLFILYKEGHPHNYVLFQVKATHFIVSQSAEFTIKKMMHKKYTPNKYKKFQKFNSIVMKKPFA